MFQSPIPEYPKIPLGPIETWLNLCVALFCLFWLLMMFLPRPWFIGVFEIAFPFMPRPQKDEK